MTGWARAHTTGRPYAGTGEGGRNMLCYGGHAKDPQDRFSADTVGDLWEYTVGTSLPNGGLTVRRVPALPTAFYLHGENQSWEGRRYIPSVRSKRRRGGSIYPA
eukprot:8058907-Pyramimonas_sp.AAC.2